MRKILIVSTVSRQFFLFEQVNINVLKTLGYEVHAAANFNDANKRLDDLDIIGHHFDIERSPLSLKNIKAFRQLKNLIKLENFDVVHCHSPMGGALSRLAANSLGIPRVIYTAHGFHFYKGAPLINWLVYYPVEKFLSRYTDILITINQEDYDRAKLFKAKKVEYVPGVGVKTEKFNTIAINKKKKREDLGLPKDAFVILSVGELNKNKNHEVIIKGLAKVNDPNVYYIICGQGNRRVYLEQLITSLGLSDRVKLLGFRNDVSEIYSAADIFAFPSYREGLSVSLMEAMASGLPVISSAIRGNVDLLDNGKSGFLFDPDNIDGFAEAINRLQMDINIRNSMGNYNIKKIRKYDDKNIKIEMEKIYKVLL